MFRDKEMKSETITQFIMEHRAKHIRYNKLERYYKGDNDILNRILKDPDRPNNKISHPFGTYITDLLVGYFMGEPVAYQNATENDADFKELQMVFDYNMEHDENIKLADNASIFGATYEILYVADDGNIEFKVVEPTEAFLVYDHTIQANVNYGVRYVDIGNSETMVEVYTATDITTYKMNNNTHELELIDSVGHNFGDVPIIKYANNKYEIGDFEKVIPSIDAYDKFVSDSLNDFDYFTNAYLAFYGADKPDEDLDTMKQQRLLFFPKGAKAEFITKDLHGAEIENHINRTEKDIHKLSKVPNSSDESFANNSSGVAMQYKLLGTENLAIKKERNFTKALQKRLKLILNFLNFKNNNQLEWTDISLSFTRNLPVDVGIMADYISKLRGIVSDETMISWLPNIENPEKEIAKRDNQLEKDTSIDTDSIDFSNSSTTEWE